MRRRLVWIQGAGNTISHNAIIGGATFGASLNRLRPGWKCVDGVCVYSETEGVYATQAECEASRVPIYQFQGAITGGCETGVLYQLTINITATIRALSVFPPAGVWYYFNYQDNLTTLFNGDPILERGEFEIPYLKFRQTSEVLMHLNPVVKPTGDIDTGIPLGINFPYYALELFSDSVNVTATRVDGLPESCPPQSGGSGNIIGYNCA